MGFFGFGKKKETVVSPPEAVQSVGAPPTQGVSPPVDAAALLTTKKEDFPFEHITTSPLEQGVPVEQTSLGTPAEKVQVVSVPEVPPPEDFLEGAPAPEEKAVDLNELAKQLPIQDIPHPPENQSQEASVELEMPLEIPEDLTMPASEGVNPEEGSSAPAESLPAFSEEDFEEVTVQEEQPLEPVSEHGRYDAPAELASDLMGTDRKVRRFKVTKINGELFVEAESYKFFLENMVTMHEDLRRTNELFLQYSNEHVEEERLYKRMFQQLNSIHEDLIRMDHELFEREEF